MILWTFYELFDWMNNFYLLILQKTSQMGTGEDAMHVLNLSYCKTDQQQTTKGGVFEKGQKSAHVSCVYACCRGNREWWGSLSIDKWKIDFWSPHECMIFTNRTVNLTHNGWCNKWWPEK